jgi:hypothetical protein
MGIPLNLRYEAQIAKSGLARCKVCGELIAKGTHILKILGHMTNESLHPECTAALTLSLRDVMKEFADDREYVIRAVKGYLKIGFYADTENPKKKKFTVLKEIKLNEKLREENPNVPKP